MVPKIALRNVLRTRRRSVMTILAIAVGGVAIVLFGEFVAFIIAGLETNAVQKVGHLTVWPTRMSGMVICRAQVGQGTSVAMRQPLGVGW